VKREIRYVGTYPHPVEKVWRALTDPRAIAEWMMDNDFEPRVGHEFTLRTDPAPGFDGIVHCRVLELDAPRTMAWSWRGGPVDTVVRFTLEPVGGSTRLRVVHSGFEGLRAVLVSRILESGTDRIYGRLLPDHLRRVRPDGSVEPAPTPAPRPSLATRVIARVASWMR
jgi:uncharacterized protein YndB with AHSA1/START domain